VRRGLFASAQRTAYAIRVDRPSDEIRVPDQGEAPMSQPPAGGKLSAHVM
jgi:hypothetical protein